MILFIIILISFFMYTIFAKDWLLDTIKNRKEYNKDIEQKIKIGCINYDTSSWRKYDKRDYYTIPKSIIEWLLINIIFNIINIIIVFIISSIVVFICPKIETHYSFNINSLKDNVVTSGKIHGTAFCASGSIDGEISYFFSRTMNKGEKIGHIPAKDSYIKYDNNVKPHIEVHQTTHVFPEWLKKILWVEECNVSNTEYYLIVVPEGTISTTGTYQIDME